MQVFIYINVCVRTITYMSVCMCARIDMYTCTYERVSRLGDARQSLREGRVWPWCERKKGGTLVIEKPTRKRECECMAEYRGRCLVGGGGVPALTHLSDCFSSFSFICVLVYLCVFLFVFISVCVYVYL